MPTIKLTEAAIQKFKASAGQRLEYFDASLPGFGLRVAGPSPRNPEGRKSWVVFYRFGGQQRRLTLEMTYPALGLAAARRMAGEVMLLVAEGKDPAAVRAETKAASTRRPDTVDAVIEEFLRRNLEGKGRAGRYIDETRRNFRNHVLPRWGGRGIKTITRRDVIDLLDSIMDDGSRFKDNAGKMKTVAGGPIAANRTLAAIRALFNWALRRGLVEATPAALVERPGQEKRRERILAPEELRHIWPQMVGLSGPVGSYFQALVLSAQRREEVSAMRWCDLDLNSKVWTIPADATKSGRAHSVPLSRALIDVLKSMPRKTYLDEEGRNVLSPWVFTVGGKSALSGFSVAKRRLDAAVAKGLPTGMTLEPWTIHDLRRTAATGMGRCGISRFVIGRVLNHADPSVTGIYDRHSYLEETRNALDAWERQLLQMIDHLDGNVVAIRA